MVRDHEAAGSSPATPTIAVADCISFAAAFSFAKFVLFLTHPAASYIESNPMYWDRFLGEGCGFCQERIGKQHGVSFNGSDIGRMVGRQEILRNR